MFFDRPSGKPFLIIRKCWFPEFRSSIRAWKSDEASRLPRSICPTDAVTRGGKPFRSRIEEARRRCVRNIRRNLCAYFPRARCSCCIYVCVYAIDVVHECSTVLAEEATREPGWKRCNKRDTFARLARRRIERTNWKPTRYVSPPVARVVKQSLLRRSIRTRTSDSTRVGFVVYLRFPLSFFLSFRFYYEWARAENGGGKEGQGRGFQDEGYLRRVLFFISRGKFVG